MNEFNYTITSTNHQDYATIHQNLIGPRTELTEFMVTKLTTTCMFVILDHTDYIEFEFRPWAISHINKVYWSRTVTNLDRDTFIDIFSRLTSGKLYFEPNPLNVLTLKSNEMQFAIKSMSYRMKLVLGMYNVTFNTHPYNELLQFYQREDEILTSEDYIEIDSIKYYFHKERFHSKNIQEVLDELNNMTCEFKFGLEKNNRVVIYRKGSESFRITDASPNMIKNLGIGPSTFSISSLRNKYALESAYLCIARGNGERPKYEVYLEENVDFITLGFDNYLEKGFRYTETYRMKNSAIITPGDNLTILSLLQESIPTMRFYVRR